MKGMDPATGGGSLGSNLRYARAHRKAYVVAAPTRNKIILDGILVFLGSQSVDSDNTSFGTRVFQRKPECMWRFWSVEFEMPVGRRVQVNLESVRNRWLSGSWTVNRRGGHSRCCFPELLVCISDCA